MIRIGEYPQLKLLCWNIDHNIPLTGEEALGLYERLWYMVDESSISSHERDLIDELVKNHGNGVFLA